MFCFVCFFTCLISASSNQGASDFSLKGQVVNIFRSVSHTVSVLPILVYSWSITVVMSQ